MRYSVVLLAMLTTLLGVADAEMRLPQWPRCVVWEPQFVGVGMANITLARPRPLRVHALRVDLDAQGLSLVTDQDNGDRELEVDGLRTSSFLLRNGCQAAINASAFWPLHKEDGGEQDIRGLVIAEGEVVSRIDEDKPRSAVVFRADRRAAIVDPPVDIDGVVTAIGGYGDLLRNGAAVPTHEYDEFVENQHPRTALGISEGGRTLILVVVDGRQPGYSEGVSLPELSEIMRLFGAEDAVNLDGGGTSTMVIERPVERRGAGGFQLVNRPIQGGVPGTERVSASHLGVRATRLPYSPQVR
ncbi:phosphodiester glycosidase family protein [Botrimarina mediterranea]|uniref:Phosphodiester glycosidase domain-containing protein n=1 Tax=Botrimarina mediterranea TaxID=2528022 RepID=A0A518K5I0_9BACT|nr:phosphodiester glycosidase family protein [Botrimarina mediterranea]QDV73027.1 hypothetical protein Spa11_12140 [Botrimarina mediterranea]